MISTRMLQHHGLVRSLAATFHIHHVERTMEPPVDILVDDVTCISHHRVAEV